MKILMVIHRFYSNNGTELYAYKVGKELINKGHDVSLLCHDVTWGLGKSTCEHRNYDGIHVYRYIKPRYAKDAWACVRDREIEHAYKLLMNFEFDIVHFFHFYGLSVSLTNITKKRKIPYFISLADMLGICPRNLYIDKYTICDKKIDSHDCAVCLEKLEPLIGTAGVKDSYGTYDSIKKHISDRLGAFDYALSNAYRVLSPSNYLKYEYQKNFNVDIEVNPLGIHSTDLNVTRKSSGVLTFGYIGVIHPTKKCDIIMEELYKVPGQCKLFLYGLCHNINELNEIIIDDRVEYKGQFHHRDLSSVLESIDMLIVANEVESYSIVHRECKAVGIPIIAPSHGVFIESIRHMKDGLLYDKGCLNQVIKQVINNPRLVDKLSVIEKQKTIQEDVDYLEGLYSESLAER